MHVNDVVIIEGIKSVPSDGFAKLTLAPVLESCKFLKRLFFFHHSALAKGGGKGPTSGAGWAGVEGRGKTFNIFLIITKVLMLCSLEAHFFDW